MTTETGAIDFFDPGYIANPYETLNPQREATPIAKDARELAWVVTRYEEVRAILHDRSLSSDPRKAAEGTLLSMAGAGMELDDMVILFMDEPEHGRLRRLVSKAFTPRAVEEMRPRTREIANGLLDEVAGEETFDFMAAFAQPLPTMVIATMIGVDPGDHRQFKAWSDDMIHLLNAMATPEQQAAIVSSVTALLEYFDGSIAERREAPRDDLISRLIAAQEGDDRLSDREMKAVLRLLINAGNLTTTDLIGNGLLALLRYPTEMARLREHPELIPHAVEEMLRYDPPVVDAVRVATHEMEIAGCPVATGASLDLVLAGANHDPRRFDDPEKFDVEREDIEHLSFGGGVHYCLGASLARLEAQVAFEVLLERLEDIQMAPGAELEYRMNPGFRGLQSLPVQVRWR
jgi:cytochrome P450